MFFKISVFILHLHKIKNKKPLVYLFVSNQQPGTNCFLKTRKDYVYNAFIALLHSLNNGERHDRRI
ncbi:MAG TPA: hypothetical protein DIW41_08700 [Lachnospiraceae bacterium]|nr:hypothetical protein [Lachnospiraceae bacterium]